MRIVSWVVVCGTLAALWTAPALAAVRVTFAAGGGYADGASASVRSAIAAHLQRLGARYIGRDAQLDITILDLKRAGYDLSSMGPNHIRVFNGATPPKMRLRYRLLHHHKLVASGEDSLSDQMYQTRADAALSSDRLRYEKAMLDDWFREEFAGQR